MLKAFIRLFVGNIVQQETGTVRVNGDDPEFAWIDMERYYQVTPHYPMTSFPGSYDVTVADFPVVPGRRNVRYELVGFSKGTNAFWAFLAFWAYGFQRPDRATVEAVCDAQHLKQLTEEASMRFPIVGLCGVPRLSGIGVVDKSNKGGHIARMNWLAEWQEECRWVKVLPEIVH